MFLLQVAFSTHTRSDCQPSNLLYDSSSKSVKVADFGLAGVLGKNEMLEDGQLCGNPRYWAPEIVDRKPWSKATDVYAWAVTTVTFVTRKDVFLDYVQGDSLKMTFLEDLLENDLRPLVPENLAKCPQSLKDLLNKCWSRDATFRPTFVEIIDAFENGILLASAIPCPTFQRLYQEAIRSRHPIGYHSEALW